MPIKTVFQGRIIKVETGQMRFPDGRSAEFEVVRHPGGAAAVALDDDERVCLLRQYRPVAGEWIWELPAGKLEPNEAPLLTAQRELEEEAGLRASDWRPLGAVWSSPGIFTEVIHLFLARGLTHVSGNHEEHELIEVHWLSFGEALARARSGAILDAKTVIGLFRAQAFVAEPEILT
jgi:ADP-ribose pyrophosphatase